MQPIDARLKIEIQKNAETVRDVAEMRRLLERFVTKELFNNKRFFPRLKTIRSHMILTLRKNMYSKIDQECLQKKIDEWKHQDQNASIYFRPKGEVNEVDEISGKSLSLLAQLFSKTQLTDSNDHFQITHIQIYRMNLI